MGHLIDLRSGKTKSVATFYMATELIGCGHFSEVYRAYDQRSKTDLAIKIYLGTDEKSYEFAKNEYTILEKLTMYNSEYFPKPKGGLKKYKIGNRHHPLIAMEIGECIFDDPPSRTIVSLLDIITDISDDRTTPRIKQFWEKENLTEFLIALCEALNILHNAGIIHRDIKPSNILLKKSGGDTHIRPLFLDFNVSTSSSHLIGGTQQYLPPEVLAGNRATPHFADDLWGISRIILEILCGPSAKASDEFFLNKFISFEITSNLQNLFKTALALNPNERYPNALTLQESVTVAIRGREAKHDPEENDAVYTTSEEQVWVLENQPNIFIEFVKILAGENEIPIFKEIKDKVSFLYATLNQNDTQSFDLKNEILSLKVNAIPSLIEEGYRLSPGSKEFKLIIEALIELSENALDLARRCIEIFCTSSDYAVREICRELIKSTKYFPNNLIESIIENNSLYLPNERVAIADLCIKYSVDRSVILALNIYMCREYVLDSSREMYKDLCDRIALRVCDLSFDQKAALIVEDTKMRIWEDIEEYNRLSSKLKDKIDDGLKELFADAFSCLGDESIEYIKENKLPVNCDSNKLMIASAFYRKLCQRNKKAREFIFERLRATSDKEIFFAVRNLKYLTDYEKQTLEKSAKILNVGHLQNSFDMTFSNYLKNGKKNDRYSLKKEWEEKTLKELSIKLRCKLEVFELDHILGILDYYRDTCRQEIISLMLSNWKILSDHNYQFAVNILTEYQVPDEKYSEKIQQLLIKDLRISGREIIARKGIEKVIK